MVCTTEGFTNKSPGSLMTPTPVNKTSAKKSLCLFTTTLYVKKKTAIRQVEASKSNRKSIKAGTTSWEIRKAKSKFKKSTIR